MRGEVHQGSDAGGQSRLKESQTYAISARVPTPFEARAKELTRGYNTTEMAADGALGGDHQSSQDHLDLSRQLHTDWGYEPLSFRILWRTGEECSCSPAIVTRYQKRVSGPLLDRIDIHVEVPRVEYERLASDVPLESSESIRVRVEGGRANLTQGFD